MTKIVFCLLLFLVLSISNCSNHEKDKSLYFLYYGGDRVFSFEDMVVKNGINAYVDTTIMDIARPLEYQIKSEEFDDLIELVGNKYDWRSKDVNSRGLQIIYYSGKSSIRTFMFARQSSVDSLRSMINKAVQRSGSKDSINSWIQGIYGFNTRQNMIREK